jgi:hypothetical protein
MIGMGALLVASVLFGRATASYNLVGLRGGSSLPEVVPSDAGREEGTDFLELVRIHSAGHPEFKIAVMHEFGLSDHDRFSVHYSLLYPPSAPQAPQGLPPGAWERDGGEIYYPPWGWNRLAFQLNWDKSFVHQVFNDWAVVYHAIDAKDVPRFMKLGEDALFQEDASGDRGILVSPHVDYEDANPMARPRCVDHGSTGMWTQGVLNCHVMPGHIFQSPQYPEFIWMVKDERAIKCSAFLYKFSGPCQPPRRTKVKDCFKLSAEECCSHDDHWDNRCFVVTGGTGPDHGRPCQSAHRIMSLSFKGQILGCP